MASAQQKSKSDKDKGTRNSTRRSGKASKASQSPSNGQIKVIDAIRKVHDGHQPTIVVESRLVAYKPNGVQVSGRGKPSGNSYKGVSMQRVRAQAYSRGVSIEQVKLELDAKVQSKRQVRNLYKKAERQAQHNALMARENKPKPRSKQSQLSGPFPYTGD